MSDSKRYPTIYKTSEERKADVKKLSLFLSEYLLSLYDFCGCTESNMNIPERFFKN